MYYNGYGERIFTSKNGKNIINKYLVKQFLSENKNAVNDFIYTDNNYAFGKYEKQLCNNIKQRLFNVPKTATKPNIVEIRNRIFYILYV